MSPHRRVSAQRPPSANGRASRAYRGRRGPPQRRARQRHSGLTKACSFLYWFLSSAQRSKLAPIFFLWSISIPRWPCRCRLSVPGSSRCREMPSPLRPLPLCLCLSTRQCEGRGQPGRPKSHSFPSAVGSVPSGEARLVAGAHISMAVLGTVTRWTGGTEL